MKKIIFLLVLGFCLTIASASSQQLIEIYKKGRVKLVPDRNFATNNSWNDVFTLANNKQTGQSQSLKILPDGSLVVNHSHRDYYSKFSKKGQFIKKFNLVDYNGSKLKQTRPIDGIINNNLFYTHADVSGNIHCTDFDGKYKKKLKINYHIKQMVALSNNKLAVVGWIQWSDKFRDFVSIIDYETNKERVIWEHFTPKVKELKSNMFEYVYNFDKGGIISFTTMPFTSSIGLKSPPQITSIKDKLIAAIPATGEINSYSLNGQLLSKTKVGWDNQKISVEEQKVIQKNAIEKYKNVNQKIAGWVSMEENEKAKKQLLQEMETDLAKISKPIQKPYFVNIIKDSDENLLFFEYPKKKGQNKFNVWIYKNGGEFICQSSFVCDDYELEINADKMVFFNGYIYAIQKLKNAQGNPLRLVRFKLE